VAWLDDWQHRLGMNIFYISPSVMPSRSANSVHVARMCEALCRLGHNVTLFIARSVPSKASLRERLKSYYGVGLDRVEVISFYSALNRGLNLRIAYMAVREYLLRKAVNHAPDLTISRNLYSAYFFSRFTKHRIIYETHQLEYGFRGLLQRATTTSTSSMTIAISEPLRQDLKKHCGCDNNQVRVLPDAAPTGIRQLSPIDKTVARAVYFPWFDLAGSVFVAGYFGQLYRGRGVEIIESLSILHPEVTFVLYGGNEAQISVIRERVKSPNLFVMGYLEPSKVLQVAALMDALLMPYQNYVAIDEGGRMNTGRWMSPMKMFEYMAVGVPIIASRLPVLQDVLREGYNCLMAKAEDVGEWSQCLSRLLYEERLGEMLANNAHEQYLQGHDWQTRAAKLIDGLSCL